MFKRKSNWWLLRETRQIVFASQLKVSQVGMKAFQRVGAFVKPATRMIQRFGHNATRARVDLNKEQLLKLVGGQPIPVDLDLDEGYVILSLREGWVLGLGLFINGRIHSQLSRKTLRRDMLQTPAPHPRDQHQRNLMGGLSLYFL
jgi:NOL1/NOP2/fmu family ribosome biogenesis protein